MRTTHINWTGVVCLVAFISTGCGSSSVVATTASTDSSASMAAIDSLYWARRNAAKMQFTQADVDFMTGMISHHAQALVISRLAPTHGASSQMRTLTARIINAQQDEIATMQTWLGDRGQPVPEVEIDGLVLTVHGGGEHAMHMPGMLSQAQIVELDQANGPAFDRLFLTFMIQHHKGAVSMVDDLFEAGGANQDDLAFKLASDISVDQITEIARMELMLESMSNSSEDS